MRLNPDCVRDVMLAVEACDFGERMTLSALCEKLPEYNENELRYTCLKLDEGGLLDVLSIPIIRQTMPGIKSINDLTYEGHEFLETIRENKNWGKIKSVAKSAGTFSLKAISQIGQSVISAAITAALQSHL